MKNRLIPVALLALAACDGPTDAVPAGAARLETVVHLPAMPRESTGVRTRQRLVIRDQASLEAFWAQALPGTPAGPPAVDFGEEMVIVATMGQRPSGGHQVTIDSIKHTQSRYWVFVQSLESPCGGRAVLTFPADGVIVPAKAEVRFVESTKHREC